MRRHRSLGGAGVIGRRGLLETGCATLAHSYRQVADGHQAESDAPRICQEFAVQCDRYEEQLKPLTARYGSHPSGEPERLHADGLSSTSGGGLGLLRDLHDLYLLASYLDMAWLVVGQAAKGARDQELIGTVEQCDKENENQQRWLMTRLKAAAPQALLAAD